MPADAELAALRAWLLREARLAYDAIGPQTEVLPSTRLAARHETLLEVLTYLTSIQDGHR